MSARRISIIALLSALSLGINVLPAEAAPALRFTKAQYNSPGSDKGANSSLNAEWVRITNHRKSSVNLTDWSVRDKTGYRYTFPEGFTLKAGASVTLHTGSGSDTKKDLYWDMTWYVWNNTGDTATLLQPSGQKQDSCKWGNGKGTISC